MNLLLETADQANIKIGTGNLSVTSNVSVDKWKLG